MDKVLVFGINGFTGKHFQDFISSNGIMKQYSFIGADRVIDKTINIDYRKIDLSIYEECEKLVLEIQPDYIMNFSGVFKPDDFKVLDNINAGISRNIFEILVRNNLDIKNVLLIGSAAEYGLNSELPITEKAKLNPVSYYGLSKVLQTVCANYYFSSCHINLNIARTFNVVGKHLSPVLSISSFVEQIRKAGDGDTVFVGNLNTKRDFLHIDDVVSAYWKMLMRGKPGEIYNVCSGKSLYMKEVLDFLIKNSGKKINIAVKDEYVRKNDIPNSYGDNSKLKRDIGWGEEKDIFSALSSMLED